MSAAITETHMGLGSFSLDLDWDPSIVKVLQSRYCHVVVYWGEGRYYAGVVTEITPDQEVLTIKGRGLDWWLGLDTDGPLVRDREYIAGNNKLSDPTFAFGDFEYRLAQNSLWVLGLGSCGFSGGAPKDDVLASNETFECRPGAMFRAAAALSGGLAAPGRLRLRVVYEGQYNPLNLLGDADFEGIGGRGWGADNIDFAIVSDATNAHSGSKALRASANPKPQLLNDPSFELGGTGWGTAPDTAFVSTGNGHTGAWAVRVGPNTKPQLLANPDFELGGSVGWGLATYLVVSGDASQARSGNWVLKVAPIPKPQLLGNFGFEAGATGWTTAGTSMGIINFPSLARTGNWVLLAFPITRPQLLANSGFESGATGWTSTGADMVVTNDSSNARTGTWVLKAGPTIRQLLNKNGGFEDSTSPSRFWVQELGTWLFDDVGIAHVGTHAARVGGGGAPVKVLVNSDSDSSNVPFAVTPGQRWRYGAMVQARVDEALQIAGTAHISLHFLATATDTVGIWLESFYLDAATMTQNEWINLSFDFEVPDDMHFVYPHLVVINQDFGWFYFDSVALLKLADNTSELVSGSVTIEPQQSYELSATVKSGPLLSAGYISLRAKLTGASLPDQFYETSQQGTTKKAGVSAHQWVRLATMITPPDGYTTAEVAIVARDVLADSFWVDNVMLEKTNNNVDEITATAVTVVPEQSYEMAAYVRAGVTVTGGSVFLRAKLSGTGLPDQFVDSPRQRPTKNKWVRNATTFRPPEGYDTVTVSVEAEDIAGNMFAVDDLGLYKADKNRDQIDATSFAILATQNYELSAMVRSATATQAGTVILQTKLSGTGMADQYVEVRQGLTKNKWVRVASTVRAPVGYDTATVSVVGEDVAGDSYYVDEMAFVKADNNSTTLTSTTTYAVVAGTRYELAAAVRSKPEVKKGTVVVGVVLSGTGQPNLVMQTQAQGVTNNVWTQVFLEVRPPSGYTTAVPFVLGADIEGESFYMDDLTLTQVSNNTDHINGTTFPITPERTYRWTQWVRSGPALTEGNVRLSVRFVGIGRADVVVDSPPTDNTHDVWKLVNFDFTPPSGYETCTPSVVSTDVFGDAFWVDDGDLRDQDATTVVFDRLCGPAVSSLSSFTIDTTAPTGAEKVRMEVVAESGGAAYTVSSVSLSRTGVSHATTSQIVRDMLLDPLTGLPMCLVPGTIHGSDVIQYDLHLLNLTARQVLLNLCRNGQALPVREIRVNPDFTLDFGQAEEICEDRPEICLVRNELGLLSPLSLAESSELSITDLTVIGAVRPTPGDVHRTVIGTATAISDAVDRFQRPVRRSRVVQEPTIAHPVVANNYAAYLLDRANHPGQNISVSIADWRALGGPDPITAPGSAPHFRVGDWVYAYRPEAGLVDQANEREVRGQVVFPARKRVLGRTTKMGPGTFRAELLPADGSDPIPLSGVRWDPATTADLQLGDLRPDFVTDPQGGSMMSQFVRYLASSPR